MKNLALVFGIVVIAGCSSSKKAKSSTSGETTQPVVRLKQPKYSDDDGPSAAPRKTVKKGPSPGDNSRGEKSEKSFGQLQFKYAILLDVPVEEVDDEKLFSFIDSWYGTPYRYGGFSKDGVDCSGFTQALMSNIYQLNLPRISAEQYNQSKRISKKELREGDLVFFKTNGSSISHVGVYLRNNKFVHASTSGGVMINDLGDDYFARRFAGSGRVR
ncbi:C40 family peptidase [Flavitalea sp.]|nr:NlpC/P60 family protein [Flavitalea sp.]